MNRTLKSSTTFDILSRLCIDLFLKRIGLDFSNKYDADKVSTDCIRGDQFIYVRNSKDLFLDFPLRGYLIITSR